MTKEEFLKIIKKYKDNNYTKITINLTNGNNIVCWLDDCFVSNVAYFVPIKKTNKEKISKPNINLKYKIIHKPKAGLKNAPTVICERNPLDTFFLYDKERFYIESKYEKRPLTLVDLSYINDSFEKDSREFLDLVYGLAKKHMGYKFFSYLYEISKTNICESEMNDTIILKNTYEVDSFYSNKDELILMLENIVSIVPTKDIVFSKKTNDIINSLVEYEDELSLQLKLN